MVPTHALRFQSMLRAMTEVVIPALDPSQRLALDQANIVAGNLRILIEQAGHCGDYDRTELREYRQLALALLELWRDETATPAATAHAGSLGLPAPEGEQALGELLLQTKQTVDELLKLALASQQPQIRQRAAALALQQAALQLTRERVWFAASGFELDRTTLPSIDDVLTNRALIG